MCHHWVDDRVTEAEFEEIPEEDPEAEEPDEVTEEVLIPPADDD